MDNRPIGIFDSGLGGLTTVRELRRIMPNENIVYFGDTSRVPYGTRSYETVLRYAKQDIRFLLSKDVKMVITACNTAAAALEGNLADLSLPYADALNPAVEAAAKTTKNKKIGLIATSASVNSKAYPRALSRYGDFEVTSVACPLFVPLVENGFTDRQNKVTRLVAEGYLADIKASGCDTLILGCTHYPIIKDIIADIAGKGVTLIDSGQEAARRARDIIAQKGISGSGGECRYYISDSIDSFSESAYKILGEKIYGETEQIDIEKY